MFNEAFMKDYLWLMVVIILAFIVYVAYLLNQDIDSSNCEDDDDDDDFYERNTRNLDEDK